MKPRDYQLNKAELEEKIARPRKADGTSFTPDEAVRILLRKVNVVENPNA